MQIAAHTDHALAQRRSDHLFLRFFRLPARHFFRVRRVRKINHAQRTGGVVGNVRIVSVDKRAVHAARHRLGVFRNYFQVRRVRSVKEHDSILAVRGSLTREHSHLLVRRGADVVVKPRIRLQTVERLGMCRIGNVVGVQPVSHRRDVQMIADDPFFGGLHYLALGVLGRNVRHHVQPALHVARRHHDRSARRVAADRCRHFVGAGQIRDEGAIRENRTLRPADAPARQQPFRCRGCAFRRDRFRGEVHHVASLRIRCLRLQRNFLQCIRHHLHGNLAARRSGRRHQRRSAGGQRLDQAGIIHGRDCRSL